MALSAEPDLKVTKSADADGLDSETVRSGSNPAIKMLAILVAASVILGGAWIGFGPRIMALIDGDNADVPVITAEKAPAKIRPENPGGMQVPNQGRLVYGVVDGTATQPRIERLLPSPEKPVAVEEVLTRAVPETNTVVSDTAPRGTADIAAAATPDAPRRLEPAAPTAPLAAAPSAEDVAAIGAAPPVPSVSTSGASAPASQAPSATAPATRSVTPAAPPVPAPTAAPATSAATPQSAPAVPEPQVARATPAPAAPNTDIGQSFRVQLAASRSEAGVKAEWDRLRRRHIDLLGDLSLQVTRVDLGATRGIFYRLRVGPLTTETVAKALCERLKQRKLGCLVVKPGA